MKLSFLSVLLGLSLVGSAVLCYEPLGLPQLGSIFAVEPRLKFADKLVVSAVENPELRGKSKALLPAAAAAAACKISGLMTLKVATLFVNAKTVSIAVVAGGALAAKALLLKMALIKMKIMAGKFLLPLKKGGVLFAGIDSLIMSELSTVTCFLEGGECEAFLGLGDLENLLCQPPLACSVPNAGVLNEKLSVVDVVGADKLSQNLDIGKIDNIEAALSLVDAGNLDTIQEKLSIVDVGKASKDSEKLPIDGATSGRRLQSLMTPRLFERIYSMPVFQTTPTEFDNRISAQGTRTSEVVTRIFETDHAIKFDGSPRSTFERVVHLPREMPEAVDELLLSLRETVSRTDGVIEDLLQLQELVPVLEPLGVYIGSNLPNDAANILAMRAEEIDAIIATDQVGLFENLVDRTLEKVYHLSA